MSKRILILLLIITIAVFTFCTKKSTTPEEQLLPPTNLTISLVENNKIQLTWTDNSTNEIKYIIDRKRGIEDWFNNYNEVSENITSFNDIIPTNSDTVYSYRLKAFDGEENSTYSDTIAWFSDNSAPKYLQIVQIAQDTLQLTWQDNSIGEQYFRIDRKIDEKGWQMNYAHVPADTTHFLDYTTALYDTCNYKVFAVNGISHSDSTENAFIPFLPTPTNLELHPISATEVKLTWKDNCHNEDGYRLFFKRGETALWDSLNLAENTNEYSDENVVPGIINYYKMGAYYENDTSGFTEDEINTLPAPTVLTCEIIDITSVKLQWNDNSEFEQGFKIDKKIGDEDWQNEYTILGDNTTAWTDEAVNIINNGYYYRIYSYFENNISSKNEIKVYNTYLKTFGGSDGETGSSVSETNDNGYIITGYTRSFGEGYDDVWLIKTNAFGNEEWNKTFGGLYLDKGFSLLQTNDNGYIIAGYTGSYSLGFDDLWLIKTDVLGNEEWSRTFGGYNYDRGSSVSQTNDNGFIITGYTKTSFVTDNCDLWLIKTDEFGNEEWNKTFGGSDDDEGYSVIQTIDNGFIVTGYTESYSEGKADIWLIKTDAFGNEEWNKTFGDSDDDEGYSIIQTIDNGFIITGYTESPGDCDIFLIKTDAFGNEEWFKTFGGYSYDRGYSVIQAVDNGFVITGYTQSYGAGGSDLLLIKTDNEGNVE